MVIVTTFYTYRIQYSIQYGIHNISGCVQYYLCCVHYISCYVDQEVICTSTMCTTWLCVLYFKLCALDTFSCLELTRSSSDYTHECKHSIITGSSYIWKWRHGSGIYVTTCYGCDLKEKVNNNHDMWEDSISMDYIIRAPNFFATDLIG